MSEGTVEKSGVTWSRVEDGFFVGSANGDFLGYIEEERHGVYLAYDRLSRPLGTYSDLPGAMIAITTSPDMTGRGRR